MCYPLQRTGTLRVLYQGHLYTAIRGSPVPTLLCILFDSAASHLPKGMPQIPDWAGRPMGQNELTEVRSTVTRPTSRRGDRGMIALTMNFDDFGVFLRISNVIAWFAHGQASS